jgi:DNA-binding LytR/AlgR family response regulator
MDTSNSNHDLFPVKTIDGTEYLDFAKIICIKANHNTSLLYKAGQAAPLKCTLSISEFEEMLPKKFFFRCHRSTIINLIHRVKFIHKENCLHLTDNQTVTISEDRLSDFLKATNTPTGKKK